MVNDKPYKLHVRREEFYVGEICFFFLSSLSIVYEPDELQQLNFIYLYFTSLFILLPCAKDRDARRETVHHLIT